VNGEPNKNFEYSAIKHKLSGLLPAPDKMPREFPVKGKKVKQRKK
jgi:hypothetical protein